MLPNVEGMLKSRNWAKKKVDYVEWLHTSVLSLKQCNESQLLVQPEGEEHHLLDKESKAVLDIYFHLHVFFFF